MFQTLFVPKIASETLVPPPLMKRVTGLGGRPARGAPGPAAAVGRAARGHVPARRLRDARAA